jgi:putative polyhydroxyalkanoate system protein
MMTKPITVSIPHDLGRAEARRRLDDGFGRFEQQFSGATDLKRGWTGDRLAFSMKAMGQGISGHIEVQEKAIRIEVLLPAFLGMIAGKLKGRLQKEGQVLLEDKSKKG